MGPPCRAKREADLIMLRRVEASASPSGVIATGPAARATLSLVLRDIRTHMALEDAEDLSWFGVPAQVELRVEQLVVHFELEGAALAGDEGEARDHVLVVVEDIGRRTGGPVVVVSGDAVFEGYAIGLVRHSVLLLRHSLYHTKITHPGA